MRRMSWEALRSISRRLGDWEVDGGGESLPNKMPLVRHSPHGINRPTARLKLEHAAWLVAFTAQMMYTILFHRIIPPRRKKRVPIRTPAGARAPRWRAPMWLDCGDWFLHSPVPDAEDAVLGCIEEGGFALGREFGGGGFVGFVGWRCSQWLVG